MAESWPPKDAWQLIEESRGKTLGTALLSGVLAMWYAFAQGVAGMINAGFAIFIDPLMTMISGVVALVEALYLGWVDILEAGASTAVYSLAPGSTWAVGPLTQVLAIGSVGVGIYVVARIVSSEVTGNAVFGTLVDNRFLAWLGTTPEEEEEGIE